ncbi:MULTISPECIES: glycosyltransferase [unclassified Pseudoalteromonas]|uniref:glycosyltransferase n=1 Tax=unclassified Pseudoalteromonas TaxID=194690 RepID=UPI001109A12F|nr:MULTISPECIES: glycosyltransferase [unclassified Pseudoalteromonas]TMN81314.1 hypothetical protein CWB64_12140 [Pseudoalteromonas sp. S410]TMN89295.1 hypothetical protein CWB62_13130 [Pseudoalteromonas sp. S408]TMN95073.1 hypothetical protein CWB61_16025 [Pseudoalteromonas sp. S407]TMN96540.1 hypothetical protein CWB63_15670 [Pseudoalteromonas sp. S409]TMO07795.1 hypothetical protein CWB57_15340 [Pseudoalteromonas sp. S186]
MERKNLVSIYIPTYNRCALLKRAIDSVLSQTYKPIELIVVDNGSTDDTVAYLKSMEMGKGIKVIYLADNFGACYARNKAIELASGTYITGLDDDDFFAENRIEQFFESYKYHNTPIFSNDSLLLNNGKSKYIKKRKTVYYQDLLKFNYIGNQLFTLRKDYLDAGKFDESLESGQDYDMWFKILRLRGFAKNTNTITQIMDASYEGTRISMSPKKKRGYFKLYKKYKNEMKARHKKLHLLRIKYQTGDGISLKIFLKLFYFGDFKYLTIIFIRSVLLKKRIKM